MQYALDTQRDAAQSLTATQQAKDLFQQQAKLHARADAIAEAARLADRSIVFDGSPDTAEAWSTQRAKEILQTKGGTLGLNTDYAAAYVQEIAPRAYERGTRPESQHSR